MSGSTGATPNRKSLFVSILLQVGMRVYLQEVVVPDRCFLAEALLWVAFQRLPVASYDAEGVELHDSRMIFENGETYPDLGGIYLSDSECQRASLSLDPHWIDLIEGRLRNIDFYEKMLALVVDDDQWRATLLAEQEEAVRRKVITDEWDTQYQNTIEYPTSQIFVALKGGALQAQGRPLPNPTIEESFQSLNDQDIFICNLARTTIPAKFWRLSGIDFEESSASDGQASYCHITLSTEDILALFPGDHEPISGVDKVGDSFVLTETSARPKSKSTRGRPSFPWDQFNLEVTDLVRSNALPQKKEAAIQHFQDWFRQNHGIQASRAAIGEKLKPFYDRFIKPDRK